MGLPVSLNHILCCRTAHTAIAAYPSELSQTPRWSGHGRESLNLCSPIYAQHRSRRDLSQTGPEN
jgi:hypothetical protein